MNKLISKSLILFALILGSEASFDEDFRPQFHFTPRENWMNDPNGLFQDVTGQYHLFFQYNPYGNDWGHMSWGHAISPDLVSWSELGVALLEEDDEMIFSGSAVVDRDNTSGFQVGEQVPYVAIYTGAANGNTEQHQDIAYSVDGGFTWIKYEGNPVVRIPGEANFRDPKVFWHSETNRWIMVTVLSNEQKAQFYASSNLKEWTLVGEFELNSKDVSVWECPDLFPLSYNGVTKWVMVINKNPGGYQKISGAVYFLGHFDGSTFIIDDPERIDDFIDYGGDFYAVTSYFDAANDQEKRTAIAWMSNWYYAGDLPTDPWRGQMSFPIDFYLTQLDGKYVVGTRPTQSALDSTYTGYQFGYSMEEGLSLKDLNQKISDAIEDSEGLLHVKAEFLVNSPSDFGFYTKSNYNDEFAVVGVSGDGTIWVDRDLAGSYSHDGYQGLRSFKTDYSLESNKVATIELIIDESSIEAFFFDHLYSMTNVVLVDEESAGLEVWIEDESKVSVRSLVIKELRKTMGQYDEITE